MKVKISIAICLVSLLPFISVGQDSLGVLDKFNYQREETNRKGMIALGAWATANIAGSIAPAITTDGHWSFFNQMNIYWNITNIGIATLGYFGAKRNRSMKLGPVTTFEKQKAAEKVYLFNSGLDIGYMATGLFLSEFSNRVDKGQDVLKGFGYSMIMQGGFLLIFDLVMYLKHKNHWKKESPKIFKRVRFTPN